MILLTLGLLLWVGAHLFKRMAPEARSGMGDKGKALVALLIVGSIVLMVLGYRSADGAFFWGRSPAMVGINNLLMLVAFYVYASGAAPPGKPRNRLGTRLRHPQLIGFSLFCVAHLLVNGDTPSFILFGGLLAWALVEIAVINRREPEWQPPEWGGQKSELRVAGIGIVVFVIVALIHGWIGPWPFG